MIMVNRYMSASGGFGGKQTNKKGDQTMDDKNTNFVGLEMIVCNSV